MTTVANRLCEMFGIEAPIFAFSHCRDVVVEVSKAGGLGVLGLARMSPQRVDAELQWIDDHIGGRPYGVDILMPTTYQDAGEGEAKYDADRLLPAGHLAFVRGMLDRAGVPALPAAEAAQIERDLVSTFNFTPGESAAMIEIALRHPIKLIVNALGSPPAELVERAHARGIKVAAMAGAPKHAIKHRDAGCDFVIAVGTEAGGHTGSTTSMVLWPRIVDAVAPLPVLGAGGIGRGRQLAAALALGCEGAWCGSIWLKTVQSEVTPEVKARMFEAGPDDAVLTRSVTGKPCRTLRSAFTDAWDAPGAPEPLPAPLQAILWWGQGRTRVERVRAKEFLTYPVGQIVADMREETSVRQVVQDMLGELSEAKERLDRLLG
ncbi:NAD(P)H-dependent flavin oxidoreductase [Caenimonas sedimenti]|uniref:NAD(P)H-dependent flavin oxidoreductase n=1 Tax=Caenimonas sedimenti TaxID=2596921 RepID=UPI0021038253|nr:nitronate monooxygenase [Caenimonas sedimenti]